MGRTGAARLVVPVAPRLGVQGGIVVGSLLGGVIAGALGVVAPFWFAFAGSALLVVVIWRQLVHIAHDVDELPPATA